MFVWISVFLTTAFRPLQIVAGLTVRFLTYSFRCADSYRIGPTCFD